jgi:hypothetical protein
MFLSHLDETMAAVAPTRTAIALTRDPSLAVLPTELPVRLTAFQISAATVTALQPQFTPTTPTPWLCQPWLEEVLHVNLTERVRHTMAESGIHIPSIFAETSGVGQSPLCGTPFSPASTRVQIEVEVKMLNDFSDNLALADITAAILSALPSTLPEDEFGPERTSLQITFSAITARCVIRTDYAIALAAYNEGLRGEALLEALGGILPLLPVPP